MFGLWALDTGYEWTTASSTALELYARSVVFAAGSFVALTAISIAAKWVLIGRFKAQSIPIWSFAYFRFWVVKTMMRTSPVMAFTGTPIYNAYLRLMGATIGRNVVISCRYGPVCADLLTIGDNTILRKDSIVLGYRAQSNFIHIGPVEFGSNVFVGEASVVDINTAMGDNTQLGHASSLQSGQRVPDGKRYHGSPAVETSSDYCPIESKRFRRIPQRCSIHVVRTRDSVPDCRAGADLRLSCLGSVFARHRRRALGFGVSIAVAARPFGGVVLRRDGRLRSPRSMSSRVSA